MKVRELIEELEMMDPDAEVCIGVERRSYEEALPLETVDEEQVRESKIEMIVDEDGEKSVVILRH
jgi:hypothetical protein